MNFKRMLRKALLVRTVETLNCPNRSKTKTFATGVKTVGYCSEFSVFETALQI